MVGLLWLVGMGWGDLVLGTSDWPVGQVRPGAGQKGRGELHRAEWGRFGWLACHVDGHLGWYGQACVNVNTAQKGCM